MSQTSLRLPVRTIGIDLGDRESAFCILDQSGIVVDEGSVATEREALEELADPDRPVRVVIEASTHSSWVSKHLKDIGQEVIVANPRQVHLISKSDRKSDRNDARLLARLGRVDPELLHPVTQRGERAMSVRTLLAARGLLVATRTRLVNMIRMQAKVIGERIPSCSPECFHRRARLQVPKSLRAILEPLLDVLAEIQERIDGYDKEVQRLGDQKYPETKLFRQVVGVGPLVALTYAVTLEDPARFRLSRSVGAYLGLTPRSYQSGARSPQLPISKRGDGDLRRLLVTAATYIMRRSSPDCDLKQYGKRIAKGGSLRDRGRARIAVARKLAALLHRLWLTGEVYDPQRAATPAA